MESSGKMEDYEVVQQIGRGALGATFLVLHKIENKRLGTVSFVCVCVFCVNVIAGIMQHELFKIFSLVKIEQPQKEIFNLFEILAVNCGN